MAQVGPSENGDANHPKKPVAALRIPVDSIRTQLEKILASEAFSHSERLRRFLRFTVEEAIKGNGSSLKEYQIGVEVFDRKDTYDTRLDPIVRVEAGRLRTKLKEFYDTEGKDDSVLIDFQKGTYVPVFKKRQSSTATSAQLTTWFRTVRDGKSITVIVSIVVAVIAIYWGTVSSAENQSLRRELEAVKPHRSSQEFIKVWGSFFASGAINYVVFGSPAFFSADREGLFVRWSGLREPAENDSRFQTMQERLGPLSGPRHDYALMGDTRALQQLTAFFGSASGSFKAIPAYEATWDGIKDGNIIFLGAPRMIPLLSRLPVEQDFEWDPEYNVVNHNPQPGEQKKYVTSSHYDETSYAIIGCFPGLRPEREILLLTAHSAPGIIAAVDYVTQPESLRALIQRLHLKESTTHRHYQLLLRIVVDKGNEVKFEYVTHHLIQTAAVGP
jgi:hypothetical protein